jgi:hypothetical protein
VETVEGFGGVSLVIVWMLFRDEDASAAPQRIRPQLQELLRRKNLSPFTPKWTKRDYAMCTAMVFAALCVLVVAVYVIARVVNYFLPVGCVQ